MVAIKYSVLLAAESPDHVEERGAVTLSDGLAVFRAFPFEDELRKRRGNPHLTAPTLTFEKPSGDALAVWCETVGQFTTWQPQSLEVDDEASADTVEQRIREFFESDDA